MASSDSPRNIDPGFKLCIKQIIINIVMALVKCTRDKNRRDSQNYENIYKVFIYVGAYPVI